MLPSIALSRSADTFAILERLVSYDTTSRESNLALIDYVSEYLRQFGVTSRLVFDSEHRKANLFATLGPAVEGGVVLSGHSDVVPVDGQDWTSKPFELVRRGDRLVGRGVTDMKGFIACALAAAPLFTQPGRLKRPVHLAISYDEEVGCLGAETLVDSIVEHLPRPDMVIVGEPSSMTVVGSHKGASVYRVQVRGLEAHSSLPHVGISANMVAIELMACLSDIAHRLRAMVDPTSPFDPGYSTLTVGEIHGGTAVNILAGECAFTFDLRCVPGHQPDDVLRPFFEIVERLDREMRIAFPGAGISVARSAAIPALAFDEAGLADRLVRSLTGDNGERRVVSYGSEAGFFQRRGFSVVICGPGSVEQAHQPDEFIEIDQLDRCMTMMKRLAEALTYVGDGPND
ncbi:MAG: acetylornithine deacetylase [Phenylobacterium sp.]|uniref:acetylornithine deacetylase n=1 Tax=Phenylobacterium sp. TaxID=1871053 RepID=UPI0025EF4E43|nr:acetylornithine deacetylase [Phenylobacterium sp.]MCG9917541.1 acetylornithine deacetylase [Phenylobacterium sp.]